MFDHLNVQHDTPFYNDDDDSTLFSLYPTLHHAVVETHNIPLVHPLHGPHRYGAGTITVTHTGSHDETLSIRGKADTRLESVTYTPYALYRTGHHTVHCHSVGTSRGGDIVLLREEEVRESSPSPEPSAPTTMVSNDAFSLEGGKRYPGVKVVKGRRARERKKNTYLLAKVLEALPTSTPLRDPGVDDFVSLDRVVSSPSLSSQGSFFHNENGSVTEAFQKFVSVTEEEQTALLLTKPKKLAPRKHQDEALARFQRLNKDHIMLLRACTENDVLMAVLADLEPSVRTWLNHEPASTHFTIALEDACHRKLLHALAEFYLVKSTSSTNHEGKRICTLGLGKPGAGCCPPPMPSESLCEFLHTGGAARPFTLS